MKSIVARWWYLALSLLFAVAVALFWAFPYVSILNYQEQYQLFLWTNDYFMSRLSLPGGFSDYISEMITQFNYMPPLGATLIAILYFIIQRLTWAVCKKLGASTSWYGLTFIPAFVLWIYQSDSDVLQSLTISLIAALAVIYLLIDKDRKAKKVSPIRVIALIIILPAFYWLFGTTVYIVALASFIVFKRKRWLWTLLIVIYTLAIVYSSSYILLYSESRLLIGLHYYRFPFRVPIMQWIVMAITLVTPYATSFLPRLRSYIVEVAISVAILLIGGTIVWISYKDPTHDLINYDYLVRTEKWDSIIKKAKTRKMVSPTDVSIVNLALYQKGQLLDRLFEFYQYGGAGLFPAFDRDMLLPIPTAEIFFRLGLVNDCERYCFEAMQAIPDYQYSGRLLRRITQCEIANGQYRVAQRYLHLFEHTTFYRAWAKNTLSMLDNEKAIKSNPTYARFRTNSEQRDDRLLSEIEMDQLLELLLKNNAENNMAYEYLSAYKLLQGDVSYFNNAPVLWQSISYEHIPKAIQEVLIGQWSMSHDNLYNMPYSVDESVIKNTIDFFQIYTTDSNDPRLSKPPYRNNAWHYILQK